MKIVDATALDSTGELPAHRLSRPTLAGRGLADLLAASIVGIDMQFQSRRARLDPGTNGLEGQVPALLKDLLSTLRRGEMDAPTFPSFAPDIDPETASRELELLRELILSVPGREEDISFAEMEIVASWFIRATAAVFRQRSDELRLQNQRLVGLLDAIPEQLMLIDPSGTLLYANRASAEVTEEATGLKRSEIAGKRLSESEGLPSGLVRDFRNAQRAARSGETIKRAFLFPFPGGARWFEQTWTPVRCSGGLVDAIAISGRDVHERRITGTRLQLLSKMGALAGALEYEEILAAIARLSIPELADLCIVDAVEDGALRRAQAAHRDPAKAQLAEELLRFPAQPCIPGSLKSGAIPHESVLIPHLAKEMPGECSLAREQWQAIQRLDPRSMLVVPLLVNGETVAVITLVSTAESERVYGQEDLALAEELARRAALLVEKARLHQDLRRSEARFRVALAGSNVMMFELDEALRYRWLYSSEHGEKKLPRRLDEVNPRQRAFMEAVRSSASSQRVRETGQRAQDEFCVTVAGVKRCFVVAFDPLRDASGHAAGIVGAAVDITPQRRVQADLAEELTFRERMMGILGHDLRNPLSAVHMSAGMLLRQRELPEAVQRSLQRIENASVRMREMIETLLDFTRSRQTGRLPVVPAPVDLGDVVRGVVEELRAARPGRQLLVETMGDVRGRWDPARMAQVVSNLAGNALTYGAEETPVRIGIGATGKEVLITVRNGGPPIPADLLPDIFEPFRRGSPEGQAAAPRGLGLGLYICRQIVLAHGGSIGVESTAERGTLFTVRLPRAPQEQ